MGKHSVFLIVLVAVLVLTAPVFAQQVQWDSTSRPDIFKARQLLFRTMPQSGKDVVFMGNSITFWGDFPELLNSPHVRNRAIPGDITFGVLELLDDVVKGKPAKIFIMAGINDLARKIPPEVILRNYKRMIAKIRQRSPGTQIYFQTILPTNESFGKLKNHYSHEKEIAFINKALLEMAVPEQIRVIDLTADFSDERGRLKAEYSWDGVHLLANGYQKWSEILKKGGYLGPEQLDYEVVADVASSGYDGSMCWFHPRAGLVRGKKPQAVLTMQKWLVERSDVFYALSHIRTADTGKTWTTPVENTQTLGRRTESEGMEVGVSDFTPKWHERSGKLLGTGHTVRYKDNHLAVNATRSTIWSVYDPVRDRWADWKPLALPADSIFYSEGAGSTQRYDLPNGDILLPTYFKSKTSSLYGVTVLKCRFDGRELKYVERGNILTYPTGRGYFEPSLTRFGELFYMTIRNNDSAYVAVSRNGLHFEEPKRWTFDDGEDLGSYNTQQHWVTHSDGLFLVYTRRSELGANVPRHRAPLFIAQVDPERLVVIRSTEKILVPNKGAQLGNFGVVNVSENETWVTTSEGMSKTAASFGADNRLYVVRLKWTRPNKVWSE